jgi:DNA-binding NarL/FixJ family response regulator
LGPGTFLADPAKPIRVLMADDETLVRAGFRVLLDGEPDIAVVGEASTAKAAVALATSERPDVVLMDIRMPVMDGIDATRQITGDPELASVRVLILTTFESDEHVFEGVRAGASCFIVKDSEPSQLLHAIRVIAAGDALLSPGVTRRLIADYARRPRLSRARIGQLDELTAREREVMALVAHGFSNHEIAQELVVSPATAKTHVSRTIFKLGARDRAGLVVIAYETGLVTPGSNHHPTPYRQGARNGYRQPAHEPDRGLQ